MIKALIIFALAAIGSAQVLRISPLLIGSTTPGQLQVINLARGGGIGGPSPYRQQQQQNFAAPQPRFQSQPQAAPSRGPSRPQISQAPQALQFNGGAQSSQLGNGNGQQIQLGNGQQLVQIIPIGPLENFGSVAPQGLSQANYAAPSQSPAPARISQYAQQTKEEEEGPAPYAFSFDSEDEEGSKIGRQETADGSGTITGQYTVEDANGIARIVKYVADDSGFHAEVQTNEPGTLTSHPADAAYQSSYGQKK